MTYDNIYWFRLCDHLSIGGITVMALYMYFFCVDTLLQLSFTL